MKTQQVRSFVCGLCAVIFTLAFTALSLTGCPDGDNGNNNGGGGANNSGNGDNNGGGGGNGDNGGDGGSNSGNGDNSTAITYEAYYEYDDYYGHQIIFDFSVSVTGLNLTVADITVSGVASKGSATLSGSGGTYWILAPITVNAKGTARVKITKKGIESETKTVEGYLEPGSTVVDKDPNTGLSFTLFKGETGYTVKASSEDISGAVVIPATYNGKPVTYIDDRAFKNCTGLTGITIPASVTAIERSAFDRCTGIAEITVPATVRTVGGNAFFGWSNTQTINIAGHPSQAAADRAWGYSYRRELLGEGTENGWRAGCKAVINYQGN